MDDEMNLLLEHEAKYMQENMKSEKIYEFENRVRFVDCTDYVRLEYSPSNENLIVDPYRTIKSTNWMEMEWIMITK
jgi:hypothetical protein